jgi:hypothetical protein
MVILISGYPPENEILLRVYYFNDSIDNQSLSEGGIFIIGKDSKGKEYTPKKEAKCGIYHLPSHRTFYVEIGSKNEGDYPAIYFPFKLNSPKKTLIENDRNYFAQFKLILMNENMKKIPRINQEIEGILGPPVICSFYSSVLHNDECFIGELNHKRTFALEKFLEEYRG